MKALYAEFTARPGKAEEIQELLVGYAASVRAEPGNRVFAPHRLAENTDKFFVYEVYADDDAFAAHLAAPYGETFNAELVQRIQEPESVLTFLNDTGI